MLPSHVVGESVQLRQVFATVVTEGWFRAETATLPSTVQTKRNCSSLPKEDTTVKAACSGIPSESFTRQLR